MRVTIENIDVTEGRLLGYMKMPSFRVHFSSSAVKGMAWFVPASGAPDGCLGQSLYVEIGHEKVTGLKRVEAAALPESVVSLPEIGAFYVQGTVVSVVSLAEPAGSKVVNISADGASFQLAGEELAGIHVVPGDILTFSAHDLSLWDEAI